MDAKYQEKWKFTSIFVCSNCGYVSEYLSYDMPVDDSCPQCKAAGLRRQVRIGDLLVDFDPTQHN